MYIYIILYIHTIYEHRPRYAYINKFAYAHTGTYRDLQVHADTYSWKTHEYPDTEIQRWQYTYIHIHAHPYKKHTPTYVHTYIHTDIHTYLLAYVICIQMSDMIPHEKCKHASSKQTCVHHADLLWLLGRKQAWIDTTSPKTSDPQKVASILRP